MAYVSAVGLGRSQGETLKIECEAKVFQSVHKHMQTTRTHKHVYKYMHANVYTNVCTQSFLYS